MTNFGSYFSACGMQMAGSQLNLILLLTASDEVNELFYLPLVCWFSKDNSGEGLLCVLSVDIPYLLLSETAYWVDGCWSGLEWLFF